MANKLTKEQFLKLNANITVDKDGNTNKKCPLCGNDVVVTYSGSVITTKCKTNGCFSTTGRGI